jgi:hypothetical protein
MAISKPPTGQLPHATTHAANSERISFFLVQDIRSEAILKPSSQGTKRVWNIFFLALHVG